MVKKSLVIDELKAQDLDNIFQQYLDNPLAFFFYKNFLPTLFSREQLVFSLSSSIFKSIRAQQQIKAVLQLDKMGRNAAVSLLVKDDSSDQDLTEAIGNILLDFFKNNEQLQKLTIMLLPEETIANTILTELKFKKEGKLKQHLYIDGEYRDVICWAIFREEFL